MKLADIEIGKEYCVGDPVKNRGYGIDRVRVVDIREVTKKVYSGARSDMFGHKSTAKRVIVVRLGRRDGEVMFGGREYDYLPQQVFEPWPLTQARFERKKELEDQARDRKAELQKAFNAIGARVTVWDSASRGTVGVSMGVEQAEELTRILEDLIGGGS